jgi:hypothetical protein
MNEQLPLTLKALALDFLMFVARLIWGIFKWGFLIWFFTILIVPIWLMLSLVWDMMNPKRRNRF